MRRRIHRAYQGDPLTAIPPVETKIRLRSCKEFIRVIAYGKSKGGGKGSPARAKVVNPEASYT